MFEYFADECILSPGKWYQILMGFNVFIKIARFESERQIFLTLCALIVPEPIKMYLNTL